MGPKEFVVQALPYVWFNLFIASLYSLMRLSVLQHVVMLVFVHGTVWMALIAVVWAYYGGW